MKKVYIPTKEELQSLQSLVAGGNLYRYLLIRVIEALIIEDVIYEEQDMLEFAYDKLSEFPEIRHTICKLYPERIKENERASKDVILCLSLIKELPNVNREIYGLDNLVYFGENDEILLDSVVAANVVNQLGQKLLYCPKYRFDYQEPNILLDNIFACELPDSSILPSTTDELIKIDPIYAIKLGNLEGTKKAQDTLLFNLNRGMIKYSNRYGINPILGDEYLGKDILSNPDERVKKLVRCLEYHRKNYQ